MPELIELSKTIGEIYLAISAPERRRRQNSRNIRRLEPRITRASQDYMELLQEEINRGSRHLKGRTPAQIVDSITDWEEIAATGGLYYEEPLRDIYIIGSRNITEGRIRKQERTDPIGIASIEWAEQYSADLVSGLTDQTRQALMAIIGTELAAGATLQQMAKLIRNTVGLNARQQAAMAALEARMAAADAELAAIKKAIDLYKKKAIRYRAMMIARTESARALSAGTLDAYGRMGIHKVQWVADPDCCDICDDNNGKVFTIQEAEDLIPAHPNCECVFVISPG